MSAEATRARTSWPLLVAGGATFREIARRLSHLRAQMEAACRRAGRSPSDVRLIGCSKRHSVEAILAAGRAGIVDLGENYAQELVRKVEALAGEPSAAELRWHFIGNLQRNKAKMLVGQVALIHAVDSVSSAAAVDKAARAQERAQSILLAVSLAGESQKSGTTPEALPELLAAVRSMPGLACRGLMTVPPWPERPEDNRPYYRALRELRDRVATEECPLTELSMGTSGDFEVAIEEGSTIVRVGTALFGPRPA